MTFGEQLAKTRTERGLSQDELGKEAGGIDKRAISRYETGKTTPSVDVARQLADALGVSLDHLTGLRYSLFIDDAELRGLLQGYEEMATGDKHIVKKLLRAFQIYGKIEETQSQLVG